MMVNNVTKIHAPSLEFPAKYKGRTGSSIRKLICHPSLWNNNNRTEIDFGLFFNIYQYTRFHTDIWRGRERLNDVFHTLNKLTWHNTAGDGGGDRDGGWHRGEQEGRLTSRPQLDLQSGSYSVLFHRTRWPTHSPALWSAGWSGTGRCCRHGHTSQTEVQN